MSSRQDPAVRHVLNWPGFRGRAKGTVIADTSRMRRWGLLLLVVLPFTAARAEALTLRDVVELTRVGLGDEVLLALIEVNQSVFAIDHETIKSLKQAGVSERVMIAMIKSGRTPPPAPPSPVVAAQSAPAPPPQVVIIEHIDAPRVREVEVPVAIPVFLSVPQHQRRRIRANDGVRASDNVVGFQGFQTLPTFQNTTIPQAPNLPIQQQPNLPIHLQQRKSDPVYWGSGGKLRPDAWKPAPDKDRERPRENRDRRDKDR